MDVFKLVGRVVLEGTDEANKDLDSMTGKAGSSGNKVVSAFKKIGGAVATYFAVDKIVGFGKDVVNTTASFEDSMLKVQSLMGATDEDYQKLSEAALHYGSTTAWTSKDVADAMGYMALAGWDANQALDATNGMLSLASASGEDLATVTDILTDATTAFGDGAADANRYADVLATTQAKSNTTVGLLGEAFKYVAPLAGSYGYALEDVSAALGDMANAGVKGSMAGTSLSAIITRLGNNTNGARSAIEDLGIEFFNSDGTARNLSDVLKDMCDATKDMTVEQKAAFATTVAGQEAQKGLLAILNQGSDTYQSLEDTIKNCDGAAKTMADNMESGVGGGIRNLQSALEGFKIRLGQKFSKPVGKVMRSAANWITGTAIPAVTGFIDSASQKFNKFKEIVSPAIEPLKNAFYAAKEAGQTVIDVLTDLFGLFTEGVSSSDLFTVACEALRDVLELVAGAVQLVSEWITEHKGIVEGAVIAVTSLAVAMKAYKIAMGVVSAIRAFNAAGTAAKLMVQGATIAQNAWNLALSLNPIGLVVVAIAGLVAAFVILWNKSESFRNFWINLWNNVKSVVSTAVEGVKNFLSGVIDFIKNNWQGLLLFIVNPFEGAFKLLYDNCEGFRNFINNLIEKIKGIISTAWETIKNVVQVAVMFITNIFNFLVDLWLLPWQFIWKNFSEEITAAWEAIKGVVLAGVEAVKNFFTDMATAVATKAQEIWSAVTEKFEAVKNAISEKVQAAWQIVSTIFNTIKDFITNILTAIWSVVSDKLESVKTAFTTKLTAVFNTVQEKFNAVKEKVTSIMTNVWSAISDKLESVKTVFTSKLSAVVSTVTAKFQEIRDKISEKIEAAKDVVRQGIEKLKSLFKFEWNLPKIKLPHFSISGKFSLDPPSIPSFGIEWYKKGAILTNPTAFGINPFTGATMVGGEAGAEAIAPIGTLQNYVRDAVSEQNEALLEILNAILKIVASINDDLAESIYQALLGLQFKISDREFARLVKAVN